MVVRRETGDIIYVSTTLAIASGILAARRLLAVGLGLGWPCVL